MITTEYFYILILDEDDNVVHRDAWGNMFPSINHVEGIIRQVATSRNEDPKNFSGKIDKRIRIIETE